MEALAQGLARLAARPHVGDVRRCGMMAGVELVRDPASRDAYPFEDRLGFRVCLAARKRGVLLRPLGNVVVLMPPLSVTVDEVRLLVDALEEAIVAVTEG
jgi:adenosylmethionine-8-amino-7-oxononanoate aminotransferase